MPLSVIRSVVVAARVTTTNKQKSKLHLEKQTCLLSTYTLVATEFSICKGFAAIKIRPPVIQNRLLQNVQSKLTEFISWNLRGDIVKL